MGFLYYGRHFVLLAGIVIVLAASSRWSTPHGALEYFGIYGSLHASTVAVTMRATKPLWQKLLFVAAGGSLSMAAAALSFNVSHWLGRWPGMTGTALLLALASGLGAVCYGALLRRCGARLPPHALGSLTCGCVLAPLVILWSGIYSHGGGLWFAAAWWLACSFALWYYDGRPGPASAR